MTRVEEVRRARGLSKAELCRRAGMPPQTLQNIENGKTKSVSLAARRMLAPVLQVREDQLLLPIGMPFDPEPGEQLKLEGLIYEALTLLVGELREIKQLLQANKPPAPPKDDDDCSKCCTVTGSDGQ
jgi:transcriptional regulator with XRE-family HTH domain